MSQTFNAATGGMLNGFDASNLDRLNERERELVQQRQQLLGPSYKLMYEHPVEIVRGEGVHLYDSNGNAYLDCYNNVSSVGHCNPHVVDAITKQAKILNTHTRYMNGLILKYSKQLLATFEPELNRVMYACTGSEAVDLALRTARFYTGGKGIIVTDYAYHGVTSAVAAVSTTLGPFVPVDISSRVVPAPSSYHEGSEVDIGKRLASDVEKAILDMKRHGIKFAAFLADTIFSTDGLVPEPAGFLKPVIDIVHQYGGIYIADEVQPGFGRTGTHMWGYQRHGITPDLVVMGKPMGNGIPISAMVARGEILDDFGDKVRYFNTFGGNPVSIAAAQAVLDLIQGGLQENCRIQGEHILGGLRKYMACFPQIGDVRGAGMYFAVEFVKPGTKDSDAELAKRVVSELRERRVLISTTGKHANSLKIRPLLSFTTADSDEFLRLFGESLAAAIGTLKTLPSDASARTAAAADAESPLMAEQSVVSTETAKEVLRTSYGINAVSIKRLPSERDQTFSIDKKWLIKFAHPLEERKITQFQTQLMLWIENEDPSIPTQHVVKTISNQSEVDVECHGQDRITRVVTYLSGVLQSDSERSVAQSWQLGYNAGKVTTALHGFEHPGQDHILLWDLQHVAQLQSFFDQVPWSTRQRELLTTCYTGFEDNVKPQLSKLRKQVVHNDYSPQNVLISEDDATKISGIIDFGDAAYTAIVMDVAIGACYQLGVSEDFVGGALAFIRGYDSVFPLKDLEINLLYDLILTRQYVRFVINYWRAQRFPENSAYIFRNIGADAWNGLAELIDRKVEIKARIRDVRFA